jgi:hypothetical protein
MVQLWEEGRVVAAESNPGFLAYQDKRRRRSETARKKKAGEKAA